MNVVCLDLEGVTSPEIWIEFANAVGVPELRKTTRDEPDYDKLMQYRLALLKEHGLGLKEIQQTIAGIELLPGAREFMDELRSFAQVIILSDTFEQFARPIMEKLGNPTIFCHQLEVADSGEITGYKLRIDDQKRKTVQALKSLNFNVISAGDSYNDVGMIQESKAGALFRTTDALKQQYPEIPALETYDELLNFIRENW